LSDIGAAIAASAQLISEILKRVASLEAKQAALEAKVALHASKLEDPPPPKRDNDRKD
jgi:hypothetical protein